MTQLDNTMAVSRRSFLKGGGALVVSLGAPVSLTMLMGINAAFAQGTKPPLTPDQLASYIAIEADGAVSEAAARAMAEGAIAHSRADLAVSITGFTEGAPGQPAGLVHLACARRGGPTCHRLERFGDVGRADVRLSALRVGLTLFRDALDDLARAA